MRQLFLQGIELFNTCIDLLDACFGLTLLFCEFLLALIKFCLAGRNLSPGIKDLILVRILLAQQFFLGLLQFRFSVGNLRFAICDLPFCVLDLLSGIFQLLLTASRRWSAWVMPRSSISF